MVTRAATIYDIQNCADSDAWRLWLGSIIGDDLVMMVTVSRDDDDVAWCRHCDE